MCRRIPTAPRVFLIVLWGSICSALPAAPWLAARGHERAAALLYTVFSPVCHQDPARSFLGSGFPWAVCHRCSGIYAGLFLLSLCPFELGFMLDSPRLRRLWVSAATAPLMIDALAPFGGFWVNTPASRFLTGLLFGLMISSLLLPAIAEFVRAVRVKTGNGECEALGGI